MKFFGTSRARRLVRHLAGMLLDLSVSCGAFLAAYLTIFSYRRLLAVPDLDIKVVSFLVVSAATFAFFGLYRGAWRYVSIPDLTTIIKAAATIVTVFTLGMFLTTRGADLPRSVLVLSFIYMVGGLSGMRMCYRVLIEHFAHAGGRAGKGRPRRSVLLWGSSDRADSFIRAARRNPAGFSVVGMLDDSPASRGKVIQGVKVLDGVHNLEKVVTGLRRGGVQVDELILTDALPHRDRLAEMLEHATALSLKISHVPAPSERSLLTSGMLFQPRPIELDDLLGRPVVQADMKGVADLIRDRTVLVTGAGGSIGSELSRQIAGSGPRRLVITDSSEFHLYTLDAELRDWYPGLDLVARIIDVRDGTRVSRVFETVRPDIVFHAAALKHVPLMEQNPVEAIKTNVLGTRNAADAALAVGAAAFVMISTDKAVNPANIMGATKRAAEAWCQALDIGSQVTRFKTVRFGNVLGSNGSVVPRFREQIAAGGPVTVTHPDIVRYFMTIPEAVRLVLHASAHALVHTTQRGGIMVLDMGKPVRIAHLAERMIQLAGYQPDVDIKIIFTGLRPGEKLYEELFDPAEAPDLLTEDGYVVAAPRAIDRQLLDRTMKELAACTSREEKARALELLAHIVPEYKAAAAVGHDQAAPAAP